MGAMICAPIDGGIWSNYNPPKICSIHSLDSVQDLALLLQYGQLVLAAACCGLKSL